VIFYEPRFGLGNIIQTTPAVAALRRRGYVAIMATPKTRDYIANVFGTDDVYENACVKKTDQLYQNCHPAMFTPGGSMSEVELNLAIVKHDPSKDSRRGFCRYEPTDEVFDIVIANGFNKTISPTDWAVKAYPHFAAVVAAVPNLRIATVGLPDEHIPGTINRTGIGLGQTFGLIKAASLFISNDTGLYHAAAALGTPSIVLFTMTDTGKNYDRVFHRHTRILSRGLPCQPCQLTGHKIWLKNKAWCGWECQQIPPQDVVAAIKKAAMGKRIT
jgi:hypothetical protein